MYGFLKVHLQAGCSKPNRDHPGQKQEILGFCYTFTHGALTPHVVCLIRKHRKIKASCRTGIIYKKGKAPVYARSTASGLSTGICTRCRIEPERWARRLERSLHRDKTALQINGIVKIVQHIVI